MLHFTKENTKKLLLSKYSSVVREPTEAEVKK